MPKLKNITKQFNGLTPTDKDEFIDWLIIKGFVEKKDAKKKSFNFGFSMGLVLFKNGGLKQNMDITITDEQKVQVSINPVTATGKPAVLDGAPTWTVTSGDSTVSVAPDGLSAFLISADVPGDTVVLVEADADLGAGVQTISDTIQLHVSGAQAAALGLKASSPVPKP